MAVRLFLNGWVVFGWFGYVFFGEWDVAGLNDVDL